MREIKSGDIVMRIRASSFAIFLFKQEFKSDLFKILTNVCKDWTRNEKLMEYINGEKEIDTESADVSDMLDVLPNGYELLQITWALNKAQNHAEKLQTPPFAEWIEKYDLSIMDIFQDVLEEAMQGFFRINNKSKPPVK